MFESKKKESRWVLLSSMPSLLGTIISIIVGVVASLNVFGLNEGKPIYYAIVISFVVFLVTTTAVARRFKKERTKVMALKDSLINAFCSAIESSSLNPETRKRRNND